MDAAVKEGKQAVSTHPIASLTRPTALAFDKDAALLVTVLGEPTEDNPKSGKLLRIAPGL